ncbi:MAG TPA: polysaccharide deacetylase family protein [Gammaproteobacteria bacterium]|nr:polysaccharide deacetylase family protein [Gammaproteobacteria bacterium]
MFIALKIDVDTLRGTLEGVPRLATLLSRLDINATFLFSLGPDHTGRALRRLLRPGFLKKVMRTSVGSNYGLKTLCYGTLLPGPDIGRRGADAMRAVRDAGFEVGIHTWDHVRWQDYVARRGAEWTRREMALAVERFRDVFGDDAKTIGAAGWQMNSHAFALEEDFGFDYASDTRGTQPFIPVVDGRRFRCPQLPTTLPTLDELVGRDGIMIENVAEHIVAASCSPRPSGEGPGVRVGTTSTSGEPKVNRGRVPSPQPLSRGERGFNDCHVFTLHAELEGLAYLEIFERVLREWQARGYDIGSTRDLFSTLDVAALPAIEVVRAEVPGRSGDLAVQGTRSRLL